MSKTISLNLEVDSKSGQATIKRVNKEFKSLGDTMSKKMKDTTKSMQKSIDSVSFKQIGIAATAAITGIGLVVKKSLDAFIPFERALANVSTLGDFSAETMETFRDALIDLPAELGRTAELTKGLYQALSAGIKPAESIEFVTKAAIAAKAGLTDVFTSVDAGSTLLKAFGLETEETSRVFDILFQTVKLGKTNFSELAKSIGDVANTAASSGVGIEEMHSAVAVLTTTGGGASKAVTKLRALIEGIVKPTSEAKEVAEKLGIEFNSQALAAKGLHGFLNDVKVAVDGNVDSMSKLFTSSEAFQAALTLTGSQSKDFTENLKSMHNATGAAQEAFDKQKKTLGALWETFKTLGEKLLILIGIELVPWLSGIVTEMTDWVEANGKLLKQDIKDYVDKTTKALEPFGKAIVFVVKNIKALATIAAVLVGIKITMWLAPIVAVAGKATIEMIKLAGATKNVWAQVTGGIGVITTWGKTMSIAGVKTKVLAGSVLKLWAAMGGLVVAAGAVGYAFGTWINTSEFVQKRTQHFFNVIAFGVEKLMLNVKLSFFEGIDKIKNAWAGLKNWFSEKFPKSAKLMNIEPTVVAHNEAIDLMKKKLGGLEAKYRNIALTIDKSFKDTVDKVNKTVSDELLNEETKKEVEKKAKELTDTIVDEVLKKTKEVSAEMEQLFIESMDQKEFRWFKTLADQYKSEFDAAVIAYNEMTKKIEEDPIDVGVDTTQVEESFDSIKDTIDNIKDVFEEKPTINIIDNATPVLLRIENLLSGLRDKTIHINTVYTSSGADDTRTGRVSQGYEGFLTPEIIKAMDARALADIKASTPKPPEGPAFGYADLRDISFKTGTGVEGLPHTGLFYGHKGEIIKNPAESEREREGVTGNTYNITVAPQFMSGDRIAARSVAEEIQRELDSLSIRRG